MERNDRIRGFIESSLARAGRSVKDSDLLLEEGIIDSFGIMALLEFVEQTFSIRIDGDELQPDNFRSIAAISALVERKLQRLAG
jgi:acyl carrier protein